MKIAADRFSSVLRRGTGSAEYRDQGAQKGLEPSREEVKVISGGDQDGIDVVKRRLSCLMC